MINFANLDLLAEVLDEHAIVSIADPAGNIIYVNDQFSEISGYSLPELIGENHRLLKSGIHSPEFYQEMWDSLLDGKVWHGEVCNRRKNGSLYWVRATIKPILDANGLPIQYISIRTDITELKLAEARLKQKAEFQLIISEISRDLLEASSIDTDSAIHSVLQRCGEYLNVDRAYLFLYAEYGASMSNTHEWCADGIQSQLHVLQNLPLSDLPWWWEQMSKGDLLDISDVAALPLDAQAEKVHFEAQQILSLIAMPLQINSKTYGFVGFDSVTEHRNWLDRDIQFLVVLTNIINSKLARNRAEKMVEVHRERLRQGQLFANIGTWDWNIQSGELFWTERIAPLFGYAVGELDTSYENFISAVHPDDRQAVIESVNACVERNLPYEIEHRVVWPDGTVRWLFERGAVVRDECGKALKMLGVVQDIDDRKKAEIALLERENQLSEAQSVAHLGSFDLNLVSGELHWSDEHFRLWGLTPGALIPNLSVFKQAVHSDDLMQVENAIQKALSGNYRYECKHRVVWPDGSEHHIHGIGKTTYDANGKAVRITGTVQDITETISSQRRMAMFQRMMESVIDGVITINQKGIIQSFNSSACAMFGYQEQDVVGRNVNILMPEPYQSEHDGYLKRYFANKSSRIMGRQLELTGCRSDGSVFPLEISITEIGGTHETIIVGVTRDITSRKLEEKAVLDARAEAERANQAKSDFLSSMSHELRTPMNAILGFAQMLEYDTRLDADQQDNVHEILKGGRHLLELINEVLDLSKIEAGHVDLSLEPIDISCVANECTGLIEPLMLQKQITLYQDVPPRTAVRADRVRFKQALLNLLSNAVKYNRDSGQIHLNVKPSNGQYQRITVTDTGLGIPPDRIEKLFQPFQRLGAEHSEIEGTGIGLTITRHLVELMGGNVGVDSQVGVGTTFWIELPSEVMQDAENDVKGDGVEFLQSIAEAHHTVLCIDDNPANLKLITQMLGLRQHIHVITAHMPELGIGLALTHQPDLILLDVNMPHMDGYQVLNVLKSNASLKGTPIIAVTANAMPRDIERGRAAGFNGYLTKPLNLEEFLEMIDNSLAFKKEGQL